MSCDPLFTAVNLVQGIFILLSIVVGLIVFIISIAYMLGSYFNNERYKSFAKRELYNLMLSLFLLSIFMPIVTIVEIATCTEYDVSMYDFTISRMEGIIYGEVYPVISNVYKMTMLQQGIASKKLKFGPGSYQPLSFLNEFSKSLSLTNFIMEISFTSLYLQSLALSFFKVTAFNLFFPLGIFFRAIPYLRDYGNFLLAFSIALSTIYPYIYFVSLETYYDVLSDINFEDDVESTFHPTHKIWGTAQKIESKAFYFLSFFNYNDIRDMFFTFGRVLFLAVGLPALGIILTVAFSSSLNKFFKEIGT
jgi:hypothetical protein